MKPRTVGIGRARRRGALAVGVLLAILGSAGCDGRPKVGATSSSAPAQPHKGPAIAVVDLSEGAPEIEAAGFLGVRVHRASFERKELPFVSMMNCAL